MKKLTYALRTEMNVDFNKLEKAVSFRTTGIDAFVDLYGLGPGRYNLRVQVDPSQTFGISAIEPAVVDVTIK